MQAEHRREIPWHLLRGAAMGSADIVPGVSGGTVALVTGIYPRLVGSIRMGSTALGRLLSFDLRGGLAALRSVEWSLLIPLAIGIGTAIVLLAGLLEELLTSHPLQMAGLVLGLVAGSTVLAVRLLTRRTRREYLLMVASGAVFFVLLGFTARSGGAEGTGGQPLWAYFVAGAIAVCAMILPGISGSFLLVAVGMYASVLAAVNDRDLVVIGVFAVGCATGLALFSQFLHWALHDHYNTVMAIMIGLMLGSLRVLWPWPNGVESVELEAPSEALGSTLALFATGLAVVLLIDLLARRLQHRGIKDEADELQAS